MKKTVFILLLVISQFSFAQKHVTFYVLNVGQGDALLLTSDTLKSNGQDSICHAMMIDQGGTGSTTTQVIIDTLKALKISHLNYLVVSHYDKDHIVGVTDILKAGITIDSVYDRGATIAVPTTATYTGYAQAIDSVRKTMKFGYQFKLDNGVTLKCVCVNGQYGDGKSYITDDENTLSIGLLIKYGDFSIYTAGDVDTPVEDNITGLETVNLIKISHHGSRTATSQVFLDKIAPQVAVISCGSNATYKHPHQEVVERLGSKSSIKYIYQTLIGSGSYSSKVKVVGTVRASVYDKYFVVDTDTFQLSKTTGINNILETPKSFKLYQNFPNPFNPNTMIKFELEKTSYVSLKVFNILGQEISTLYEGSLTAGNHTFTWSPNSVSSGLYYYILKSNNNYESRKMVYLK